MTGQEHASGRRIEAAVDVTATPEQAFEAWADPEKIAGWFVDRARGRAETGATMTWYFDRFGLEIPYRVMEAVPGERIVFGPASDQMPPFVLEIIITRHAGATNVRLINSGFSEAADFDEQFAGTVSGWTMALGALKQYVEHHDGERRADFMVLRAVSADYDRVRRAFTEPAVLGRWLGTPQEAVRRAGAPVSLQLLDGGTLTGRVLALTLREASLSWDEIEGVLELKAFSQGPQMMVGLRGWGWGMDAARAQELERDLSAPVERLVQLLAEPG